MPQKKIEISQNFGSFEPDKSGFENDIGSNGMSCDRNIKLGLLWIYEITWGNQVNIPLLISLENIERLAKNPIKVKPKWKQCER